MINKTKAHELCIKSIADCLDSQEEEMLREWLESSSDNQSYYQDMAKVWQEIKIPEPKEIPDKVREWEKLEKTLLVKSHTTWLNAINQYFKNFISFRGGFPGRKYRFGFASVISLVIFILLYMALNPSFQSIQVRELITGNGERNQLTLYDGSKIILNHQSKIQVQKKLFSRVRQVSLQGEAYFEVVKDKKPFIVVTENAKITVLGTSFNVWSRSQKTRVIVKHGKVRVRSKQNPNLNMFIEKDEMGQLKQEMIEISPERVDSDYLLGWLENRLVFEKMSLSEIIKEIERVFDIIIVVDNQKYLAQTLTADFGEANLETVLNSLCLTLGSTYRFESEKYRIQ